MLSGSFFGLLRKACRSQFFYLKFFPMFLLVKKKRVHTIFLNDLYVPKQYIYIYI